MFVQKPSSSPAQKSQISLNKFLSYDIYKKTLQQLERYCFGGQESAEFCSIIASLEQE